MAGPLAIPDDVADMWRPLAPDETSRVYRLIDKASALLRQKAPWVDARVSAYRADSTGLTGLAPDTVATVVATIVKRFLVNPDGATNSSETVGPFSHSKGFALRGDKDIRGELYVAESDIEKLRAAVLRPSRLGSLRVAAALLPGRLGPYDTSYKADTVREGQLAEIIWPGSTDPWL